MSRHKAALPEIDTRTYPRWLIILYLIAIPCCFVLLAGLL